jgi:sorbitol-6-phosphate 2-dehydrogenase
VTGGAQGFGEEIVRRLAASGSLVFVADLNADGAAKLAEGLNAQHGRRCAFAVGVDISKEESVRSMIDFVVRTAGGIDLFVSNAGVLKAGSVKELGAGDFEFVTKVNYIGYFLCTKWASRVMAVQNRPSKAYYTDILQINSKSGLEGSNKNGAYAGSKFGGIGLTQSFALELVTDNIKVNAVCPGNFFDGPLWSDPDRGLFVQYLRTGKVPGARTIEDVKRYYERRVPMGRGCSGADVIKAIYYLVEQKYETGQAVPVTGGQVMLS